jgi:hypothetical protein
VVVPPNAAETVALSNVSALRMPAAETCSMCVAVDAAGQHHFPARVDLLHARRQITAHRCDGFAVDRDIGWKHRRGGRDGAAAQHQVVRLCGHGMVSGGH